MVPALLQITVAEALLTLLQFVLLLVIGWAVDVKVWQRFMPNRVANNASDAIVVSGSCVAHACISHCKQAARAACSCAGTWQPQSTTPIYQHGV
jgi:hypothetical protein